MTRPLQILLVCLSALQLILLASPSHAARINVSSAAEIAAADPSPGDTLQMTAGEWKNQKIVFSAVGTASAPIKLVGSDAVTLTGTSSLKMSGAWLVATGLRFVGGSFSTADDDVIAFSEDADTVCNNCTLSHSLIQDHKPKDRTIDYKWVSLYGQRNKVYNCTFQGKVNLGTLLVVWKRTPTGVVANDEDRHSIAFNRFIKRTQVPGYDNDQEAVRIGTSTTDAYSNTAVYSNYFEDMNGEVEVVSSKSHGNQFYNNTFVRCKGGLTLRRAERNVVFGNKFYGQVRRRCVLVGFSSILNFNSDTVLALYRTWRGRAACEWAGVTSTSSTTTTLTRSTLASATCSAPWSS
jgi:poly(beta-D-mannuronate) lyase